MNKIKEYYYDVETRKINNTRIVLIADIHYYKKCEKYKLDLIYNHIKKLNPDYIAIAGDLIDGSFVLDLDILKKWLIDLSEMCKVVISIGNHELVDKQHNQAFNEQFFNELRSINNIIVLDNENFLVDNINFLGLTMPVFYYYKSKEPKDMLIEQINLNFKSINKDNFNILLCHSPLRICNDVLDEIKIRKNLDLVLSGHTHGGVTPEFLKPILKGRGLISPVGTILFKNAYGINKINNTILIITSGVTKAGHSNKFYKLDNFFTREITIIDIKKKN